MKREAPVSTPTPAFLAAYGEKVAFELHERSGELGAALVEVESTGWSALRFVAQGFAAARRVRAFRSPDGECRGVLAGEVVGLASMLRALPEELEPQERLGLHLCELHRKHGDLLGRALDGVFALILLTGEDLLLVRDAIGEHPVYVCEGPDGIAACDRLAPLLALSGCRRELDAGAIADYLATGFCPFDRTPVAGIRKLPPGGSWRYTGIGAPRETLHHRLPTAQHEPIDDPVGRTRSVIARAVENRFDPLRLKAALLLSGGLDSSLVGAVLGRDRLCAAYSLSFGTRHRNELEHSSLVAKHIGVPHRVIELDARRVRDAFPRTLRILDEPIGDPLTVPNVLVAEEVARDARQLFNGEGGDPLFGGPKNLPMLALEAYGGGASSLERAKAYLGSFQKGDGFLAQLLEPDFQNAVASRPSTASLLAPHLDAPVFPGLLDRLMHANLRLKGAAQILPKVFKVASAAGIVAHSPLFDRTLAELAFALPVEWKLRGSTEKFVLKEAARGLLPRAIIERPKSGMLVPVRFWLGGELSRYTRDTLLSRRARERGLFRAGEVQRLLGFHAAAPGERLGDRLWLLLSLEIWLDEHGL